MRKKRWNCYPNWVKVTRAKVRENALLWAGRVLTASQAITSKDWDLKLAIQSLRLSPPRKHYRSRRCTPLPTMRVTICRIKSTFQPLINYRNLLPSFLHISPLPPRLLRFRTDQPRPLAHRPSLPPVHDSVRARHPFFLPFPSLHEERRRQCRSSKSRKHRRM